MILFGWKTKPQVKGATKGKCFACKKLVQHAIVQVTHWFTLYFIPIIPYKKQLFVVCHNCGAKTELKDDAKKMMIQKLSDLDAQTETTSKK